MREARLRSTSDDFAAADFNDLFGGFLPSRHDAGRRKS
jgi:hypothetical protein